jgi:ubiquinone/menaquinone biosynthesis C-methylase UbiE
MSDDLASGFKDVDRAADFALFTSCLDLIESMPFFAECKRDSFALLGAAPGRRVLDLGCGLGDDAAALARLVSSGGSVVGVDGSQAMVDAARQRHGAVEGVSFQVADAAALPFDDASFDACRIDRVLQHIADPAPVIGEMARVVRPGGVLVAFDNDWETLTIDAADRSLTRAVVNAWCDRFPSGWIGRQLVPLFLRAGLRDVVASPRTLVLRELDTADRLYSFIATAARLADAGVVQRDAARRWTDEVRAADVAGRFFSSYTGFLVSGTRPARVPPGTWRP